MRYVQVSNLVIDYHGLINQSKGGVFIGMFYRFVHPTGNT